jgi:hypothetical protein
MLTVMSVFSLDVIALDCLDVYLGTNPYFAKVYLWCLIPLIIALFIVIIALLRISRVVGGSLKTFKQVVPLSATNERRSRDNETADHVAILRASINDIVSLHIWLLLLLSYIVLPAVSNKQLQVFDCIKLKSGERYMREDTSISCRSKEYDEFRSFIIIFVVLYHSVPIIWMILLIKNKSALTPHVLKCDEKLALFTRDNDPDLIYIRFLFIDYKLNKWWFEVADMTRRIVFIGILPLVSPNSATRASFGLLLGFLGYVYFSTHEPYRVEFTNVIAYIAQVCLSLSVQ